MARLALRNKRKMEIASSVRHESSEGVTYHAKLEEQPGKETKWYDRAFKRDFSIGLSLGSLATMTIMGLTGGTAAIFPGALIIAGGIMGASSDYVRNTKEIQEGVDIPPPTFFNRDTLKTGLFAGAMAKLVMLAGAFTLGLAGIGPVGAAMAGASGLGALAAGVSAAAAWIPGAATVGAVITGGVLGARQGAQDGYKRMQNEYEAAKIKNEHPEMKVLIQAEPALNPVEAAAVAAAPIAATMVTRASEAAADVAAQTEKTVTNVATNAAKAASSVTDAAQDAFEHATSPAGSKSWQDYTSKPAAKAVAQSAAQTSQSTEMGGWASKISGERAAAASQVRTMNG